MRSADIIDGQVKSVDIGNRQVRGLDVRDQSLTAEDIDWSSLDIITGTGNAASCNDDQGAGSSCVSTTITTENIGAIIIHATGTWATFGFDDQTGPTSGSDNPNRVQGRCNLRFDGIQVGPVQELGEADVSGTGAPSHPAGYEGTVALTARTIYLPAGTHTVDLFCTEADGDIDFHDLDITAQGSIG